jgi:hypothetical protein
MSLTVATRELSNTKAYFSSSMSSLNLFAMCFQPYALQAATMQTAFLA